MATIIQAGGGGSTVTMLASLNSIPKTSTAVSGTENWKSYDAIYFECFMHYGANENAVFTNFILTDCVSLVDRYQPIRVSTSSGNGSEIDIYCYFSENKINMAKDAKSFDLNKLNIYGVKF